MLPWQVHWLTKFASFLCVYRYNQTIPKTGPSTSAPEPQAFKQDSLGCRSGVKIFSCSHTCKWKHTHKHDSSSSFLTLRYAPFHLGISILTPTVTECHVQPARILACAQMTNPLYLPNPETTPLMTRALRSSPRPVPAAAYLRIIQRWMEWLHRILPHRWDMSKPSRSLRLSMTPAFI